MEDKEPEKGGSVKASVPGNDAKVKSTCFKKPTGGSDCDDPRNLRDNVSRDKNKSVPVIVTLAVHYPRWMCITIFAFAVMLSALGLPYLALGDPLAGLRLKEGIEARRADGWLDMVLHLRESSGSTNTNRVIQQSVAKNALHILFLSNPGSDNVFTIENIATMAKLQDAIAALDGYTQHCHFDVDSGRCAEMLSPVRYLRNASTDVEIHAGLKQMWLDSDAGKNPTLALFGNDFDNVTHVKSNITQISIAFGLPLAGYKNSNDQSGEQIKKLVDWMVTPVNGLPSMKDLLNEARSIYFDDNGNKSSMPVTYYQTNLFNRETNELLFKDAIYAIGSIVAVFMFLIIHTRSFFLALAGLLTVLLAFPVCFFIYAVLLRVELFSGLNIISVYLLLGIGVDDIFIIFDALQQANAVLSDDHGWDFETRLGWAFKRASFTIFATTITTAVSFLLVGTSAVPIVKYFGIFTGMLILTVYCLVTTLFLSFLVIHHNYIEGCCCKKGQNEKAILEPASKAEEINFTEDADEKDMSRVDSFWTKANSSSLGFIESFFRDHFSRWVITKRSRYIIFGIFASLFLIALGIATKLRPDSLTLLFWPPGHYFEVMISTPGKLQVDFLGQSGGLAGNDHTHLVFGVDPPYIDRTGTSEANPNDRGTVIYLSKDRFDITTEESQRFLANLCLDTLARNDDDNLFISPDPNGNRENEARCFMRAFELWRQARNQSFPILKADASTPVDFTTDLAVPKYALHELFVEELLEFLGRPEFGPDFVPQVSIERDEDNFFLKRVRGGAFHFVTETTERDNLPYRRAVAEKWNAYLEEVNANQPISLGSSENEREESDGITFYTSFVYYVFLKTQELTLRTMYYSLALSLLFSLFMATLATGNWILGFLTLVPVAGTVVTIFGMFYSLGWRLGSIEAANIVLIVGISIDYSLHLGVAYEDGRKKRGLHSREAKTQHALVTLGRSVLFGSLTTFFAGFFLIFATVLFFSRFGAILAMAVIIAVFWALILYSALLAQFGPEHGAGKLPKFLQVDTSATNDKEVLRVACSGQRRKYLMCYSAFLLLLIVVCVSVFSNYKAKLSASTDASEESALPVFTYLPSFEQLEPGQWNEIRPGGKTICSKGSDYSFFVRRGSDPTSVIFNFEGGGACWSVSTCQSITAVFKEDVKADRAAFEDFASGNDIPRGIEDPFGPYKDFTIVYIPYCSGDLHWGNNTVHYTDSLTIVHNGAENAGSAVFWALEQFEKDDLTPERILVTGCSAGAYGSWLWGNVIAKHYLDLELDIILANATDDANRTLTKVFQMGDSGMGIISDGFLIDSFPSWKTNETTVFPSFLFSPSDDIFDFQQAELYNRSAHFFLDAASNLLDVPSMPYSFGQLAASYDWNQAFFFFVQRQEDAGNSGARDITNEDKVIWNLAMRNQYQEVFDDSPPNLHQFILPGDYHCNIDDVRHYQVQTGDGQRFFKILHDMWQKDSVINSNSNPEIFDCEFTGSCKQGVDLRTDVKLL